MKRIYVGPKQSTIENSNFFDSSITLFGNNTDTNTSYESFLTFEYWNPDNNLKEITLYNRELAKLTEAAEVMAHNPLLLSKCKFPNNVHLVCLNDISLLAILDNKIKTRELIKTLVPMLDYYIIKGQDFNYDDLSKISNELVVQHPRGSGGSKTFLCNKENFEQLKILLIPNEYYSISAYQHNNVPYNIHCLIGEEQIELLPPSKQELEIIDKIEFIGSDFDINIPNDVKMKLIKYSTAVCEKLQTLGYRGVLGIDFIYANNELYFIEINPRFQGSTRLVDKLLKESKLPSIFEYNYNFFNGKSMPNTNGMIHSIY